MTIQTYKVKGAWVDGPFVNVGATEEMVMLADYERTVAGLCEALKKAKETIHAWHGPIAWDIYDRCSPEMKQINAALLAEHTSGSGKETK